MVPDYIIFSDGSLRKIGKKTFVGYSCVVLNTKTGVYTTLADELSSHRTIVYCEVWAVYRGLQYLQMIRMKNNLNSLNVLVVSDSQLLVTVFNDLIKNQWDLSDWNNWKKANGKTVKNQQLYRSIVELMNECDMKVRFVHINSHTNFAKEKVDKIRTAMKECGIRLNEDQLRMFIRMNSIADDAAQRITYKASIRNETLTKMKWKESEEQ